MYCVQVPGLNAPIPPGTQFGYQAGGWGKPPVNEAGEPLYGDVFGQFADEEDDEQVQPDLTLPAVLWSILQPAYVAYPDLAVRGSWSMQVHLALVQHLLNLANAESKECSCHRCVASSNCEAVMNESV